MSERKESRKFPPCIAKLVEKARAGLDMDHRERFVLATYLLKTGWSVDAVVDLFRSAPNFSEKAARHQIRHIAERKYGPPNCKTLRAWGICEGDCGVESPLSFFQGGERS